MGSWVGTARHGSKGDRAMKAAVLGALALIAMADQVLAGQPDSIEGDWSGVIETPISELPLVLHAHGTAQFTGAVDSPSQNVTGLAIEAGRYEGGVLAFDVPRVSGHFDGRWDEGRGAFVG